MKLEKFAAKAPNGLLPPGVRPVDIILSVALSQEWIVRRVVSLRLREDGCNYLRVSLDVAIPHRLRAKKNFNSGTRVLLPITFWSKTVDMHRLDFRDSNGASLQMAHSATQAELVLRTACEIISWSIEEMPVASVRNLRTSVRKIIQGSPDDALEELELVRCQVKCHGVDSGTLEDLDSFLRQFTHDYLVAVWIQSPPREGSLTVKYNMGLGTSVLDSYERPPARSIPRWFRSLGEDLRFFGPAWLSSPEVGFWDEDSSLAKSTHFEIEVSGEVLITGLGIETAGRLPRATAVATLDLRPSSWSEESVQLRFRMAPKKSSETNGARYVSGITFSLLSLYSLVSIAAYAEGIGGPSSRWVQWLSELLANPDSASVGNAIAVVLAVGALGAVSLSRQREHALTAFVLRPFRWITTLSAGALGTAAVATSVLAPQSWWLALLPLTIAQGYVVSRYQRVKGSVVTRGKDL